MLNIERGDIAGDLFVVAGEEAIPVARVDVGLAAGSAERRVHGDGGSRNDRHPWNAIIGGVVLLHVDEGEGGAGVGAEAEGKGRRDGPRLVFNLIASGDAGVLPEGVQAHGGARDGRRGEGLVNIERGAVIVMEAPVEPRPVTEDDGPLMTSTCSRLKASRV